MDSLDKLIENAIEKIAECPSFSVSTLIPKNWLTREETVWDFSLEGSESIKTHSNRYAIQAIAKKTGSEIETDGDVRITFDIEKGEVSIEPNDLFIFGRYSKLITGISQSRWKCTECSGKGCKKCNGKGKMYDSVEEKIGEVMKEECNAKEYTMHASGREDIDVRNEGKRPFVMQINKAGNRKTNLKKISERIEQGKEIAVHDLKLVKRGAVELVSSSHFDKEYEAEVEFERETTDADIEKILSVSGKIIEQVTPERVAHRRAMLTRKRKILSAKLVSKNKNRAVFRIKAEAGTYIKELITGDNGRTKPNFSSLAEMKVECKNLKVLKIDDEFLKETIG